MFSQDTYFYSEKVSTAGSLFYRGTDCANFSTFLKNISSAAVLIAKKSVAFCCAKLIAHFAYIRALCLDVSPGFSWSFSRCFYLFSEYSKRFELMVETGTVWIWTQSLLICSCFFQWTPTNGKNSQPLRFSAPLLWFSIYNWDMTEISLLRLL